MGFEYDLAKVFADFLGVELKVRECEPWDELLPSLVKGNGEVVAASMTITPSRSELVDFSREYLPVQQMVITHKDNSKIKSPDDLEGKAVHVRRGTSYEDSLRALKQTGLNVMIKLHEDVPTEDLIQQVAQEKIEMTISDSNVALLNRRYYPDIRIAFPITQPQSVGWAVKRGERKLLDKINEFFETIHEDGTFNEIYSRYYAYVESFDHLDIKRFQERIETRLPRYESTIKKAAQLYEFDWRLIAALIYQESQFNPWAKSFSGVRGLMQLTQPTAEEGGVRYLKKLHDLYDKASEPDRTLIALAAYNVGKGHVLDARTLASNMKLDPNKWSSLERTLPLLRQRRYYEKSQFGYCRGTEPVFHVQNILTYYDILKREAIEYAYQERR
jgi:membrane-bound lytic murein transglycosylase F